MEQGTSLVQMVVILGSLTNNILLDTSISTSMLKESLSKESKANL